VPTDRLEGATVVLGVSGGIAAYKAVELCRRLVDAGAEVVPVLTASALRFVGAATFSALGSERARTSLFEDEDPIPHTSLGQRADLVLVAPATARLVGSYAAGISSDLLTTTLIATRAPVLVCPAMHTEMWQHPAVQENIATLRRRGVTVLEPESGRLAGGDVGEGRLASPEAILAAASELLGGAGGGPLAGKRVLVTAGGTREAIDPVRYIGNRSSGKQGHALAEVAARLGAEVTLVTTAPATAPAGVEVVPVTSAAEMAEAVLSRSDSAEVVVMAAAVADFRPKATLSSKWKKADGPPEILLEPTTDILRELGRTKRPGQLLVGFAAETGREELLSSARRKLEDKRADLVVGNDVSAEGAGFEGDTNAVTLVTATGATELPLASKHDIAAAVMDLVAARLEESARPGPDGAGPG
jgi:phosphopantothenoylcysteine decarboxylase/phosphopantothenate--cysteine ligase